MVLTPTGPGLGLFLVSIILLAFSWVTVGLRMWARIRINSVGSDDYLMLVGLLFFTAACQATIAGSLNGVGAPPEKITQYYDEQGKMWFMFFQLFYVLSTVPIKASICVALLRIATSRMVRTTLYSVIILAAVAAFVTDVTVLAWCKPIAATWKPSLGTCADASIVTNVSYFISAVSILTDWTCAIMPAIILWDVQLQYRIKVPVMIVLGLGFVASAATLVRLRYLLAYNDPGDDYLLNIAHIAIWSITESGLGLIAGSMATLRPLLRSLSWLRSVFSSGQATSKTGRSRGPHQPSHQLHSLGFRGNNETTTACEGGDRNDWERLSDSESQKAIVDVSNRPVAKAKGGITVTTAITQH